MLDLSLRKVKYYKLKWFDGKELNLAPPSQRLYQKIARLNDTDGEQADAVITEVVGIAEDILKGNINQIELDFSQLSFDVAVEIIGDYFNFYNQQMEKSINFPKQR